MADIWPIYGRYMAGQPSTVGDIAHIKLRLRGSCMGNITDHIRLQNELRVIPNLANITYF